jgi:hypothetical protein
MYSGDDTSFYFNIYMYIYMAWNSCHLLTFIHNITLFVRTLLRLKIFFYLGESGV